MRKNIMFLACAVFVFAACGGGATAEDHISAGNEKYELRDYEGAVKDYDRAIKLQPDYAMAYLNRGLAKYMRGERDAAIKDLKKSAELGYEGAKDVIEQIEKQ
ncbi:MAG TPA: tetratricopeptide repeat protein [bacterium]|nr:tetratricopeptide repeat protein [bacterium]